MSQVRAGMQRSARRYPLGSNSSLRSRAWRQVGVNQLHGHRPFAYGGGTALGRARPNVTSCEDALHAGLEDVVGACARAGEDEAFLVARDGVAEPLGAWSRAEEEEQECERHALTAFERDRFELAVGTVQLRNLAAVLDGDAEALELADEVVGHRLAQVGAAM